MIRNQFCLEKYAGRSTRYECPNCHDLHSFTRYIDETTGEHIHQDVGRCNHESGCGYHYTPKQYFTDNPVEKKEFTSAITKSARQIPGNNEVDTIPFNHVQKSAGFNSTFVFFLCSLFDRNQLDSPTIKRIVDDYALGATKDNDVIYWQINITGKVRTGKIMKYNKETGKRIKENGSINWVHAVLKKQKLLPENFNLKQCLFGEHLLKIYPNKTVALVESEKSALIGYGVFPDYVWLATGGKSQLSIDKLKILKGRTVVMFPDVDGYDYWLTKAKELESYGYNVLVSDLLEKNATVDDRANRIDIADWLIRELLSNEIKAVKENITQAEKQLAELQQRYPILSTFIERFDLVLVENV